MRRRSAGARAGNALAARGSAWAAQRFGSGRARASRERKTGFAVCRLLLQRGACIHGWLSAHYVGRSSRPPALLGLAGTLAAIPVRS